jgi:hypothetical protein
MNNFAINQMPSRKPGRNLVVFYVKDSETKRMVAKFNNNIKRAEDIPGWEEFTSSQKLELKNFVSNIHFFSKKLKLPEKLNKNYRLSLPEPLQDAMVELFEKSQQHDIEFNPMQAMLSGLLKHITSIEKKILAFKESSILEKYGITSLSEADKKQVK